MAAVDLENGTLRWSRKLPRQETRAMPCEDVQVTAGARVAVAVCTWDLTDYPLGPENLTSTVYVYNARAGSQLRQIRYAAGPIVSAAVARDGRILVARANPWTGWVLDVANAQPRRPTLTLDRYYPDHTVIRRTLAVIEDQVLALDAGQETLRSLR